MTNSVGIIFDMDGVLIDSYDAHYRSWLAMAEPEGLHFSPREFKPTFGRTSREIIATFWGKDRFDDAEIAALDDRKEAAFRQLIADRFPAMPGAAALIRGVFGEGFALAVGSSGPPENIDFVVDRLRIRSLLAAVVTGRDVRYGKPNPEVFLLAAQRLGLPPAHCAVIEDAPAGITAAQRAGMLAIGLVSTGRTHSDLAAADMRIDHLHELTPQLLRWRVAAHARRQCP